MRVLFVTNASPWPADSGIAMRVQSLLAGLVRQHEVTVVTLEAPRAFATDDERRLHAQCAEVITVEHAAAPDLQTRFDAWAPIPQRLRALVDSPRPAVLRRAMVKPALVEVLADLRRRRAFDLAIIQRASLAELVAQADIAPIAVDLADLDSVWRWRALRAAPAYASKLLHVADLAKLWWYEQSLPVRFDRVLVCKPEDRAFFAIKRNVHVVRNGIADFPALPPAAGAGLLFTGMLSYEPNIDAVTHFHAAIWPGIRQARPDATLSIVGRDPVPAVRALDGRDGCAVYADVDDIAPYFARAALVIAPIRLGSGTRLKVLDALARGKAMVASPTALEGLDLRPGIDLEVASDSSTFASTCVELLGDESRRRALAESGRSRALQGYGWHAVHDDLDRALKGCAAEDASSLAGVAGAAAAR